MSIIVNKDSRVIVQGFTGREGSFHSSAMISYGTHVIGGITPGKGGTIHLGLPVFNSVGEAMEQTGGADVTVIFVPAPYALEAMSEAADAGVKTIVCITEGIPVNDVILAKNYLHSKGVRLIGPNCPGIITPPATKVGIMPGFIHAEGNIGIISRSGTLAYEAVYQVTRAGLGQSTAIGVGGDPVVGTTIKDALELFMNDNDTSAIVMIGEIGGSMETDAATWYMSHAGKPVIAYLAGLSAPKGKTMGHAGAIISSDGDTVTEKKKILRECGILVADSPAMIGNTVVDALKNNFACKV